MRNNRLGRCLGRRTPDKQTKIMSKENTIPEYYAFNHDDANVCLAIGITDERAEEIIKHCRRAEIGSESQTHIMEEALNTVKPKSMIEVFFTGYCVGIICEERRNRIMANRFIGSIKGMIDNDEE